MNPWLSSVAAWLGDFYLLATVLMLGLLAAMARVRQPSDRLALAWAVTTTLLSLAVVTALPGWPRVHLVSAPAPHEASAASAAVRPDHGPPGLRGIAGAESSPPIPTHASPMLAVEETATTLPPGLEPASIFTLRAAPGNAAPADAPGGEEKKEPAAPAGKPVPPKAVGPEARVAQGLSYTGRVIDKLSRQPIQGATVLVRRSLLSPTENPVLEETKHETDAQGNFRFSLTAEQAGQRYMYLEFEATHPKYARRSPSGYALSMIRKNEKLGGRPFFETLEMSPGEEISGTVVRPDGTPAAGIEILTYSKAKKNDLSDYGSFLGGKTDAKGVFRLNVVKGGEAILWLIPTDYSPSTHLLHQKRGDLGRIVLEKGIMLRGRVLDVQGKPVANVWVNAELRNGPAKQPISTCRWPIRSIARW